MTKTAKKEKAPTKSIVVDAQLRGEESVPPSGVAFWRLLETLVAFVPAHRNSRKGRAVARQVRIGLVVTGILMMAFGGQESGFWIVFGVFVGALAFLIPVTELKKRSWRAAITEKQKPQSRTVWATGSVVFDGRRVELRQGTTKVRHVLVDRDKHRLVTGRVDGKPCLSIQPPGGRKKESIWLCADGEVETDLEDTRVDAKELDRPARLSPRDFTTLWKSLSQGTTS